VGCHGQDINNAAGLAASTKFLTRRCIVWNWRRALVLKCRSQSSRLVSSSVPRQALEQLIGTQAVTTDLKPAVLACLTGTESRRWTIAELSDRLHNLGITRSKPAIVGALTELELEISLCSWLPWTPTEKRHRMEPRSEE
jgi:hypothetical protein